ncbi:DUF411 domain-containing protein [Synechococcus sp. PCC 7335]|uniref:DUF411 domain-containing protein n=1 Tax=Synechococcus sp. (strain ATCC 29403 / PCC 7335) TaxID=91464 RepID=UPI001D0D269A|nr:DUF411 domain-containing protein [Synechococcus sp. PCC 7335]
MTHRFSKFKIFVVGLAAVSSVLAGCTATNNARMGSSPQEIMATQAAVIGEITVFRSPTCGCCGQWIEHAEAAGFKVKDEITEDMSAIKQQYGVPTNLSSCHTTVAGDYIVEGHVPAEDLARLLAEKPDVAGIAVPGMPIGSPGMESGDYTEPYTVFSFTESGETAAFAEHS